MSEPAPKDTERDRDQPQESHHLQDAPALSPVSAYRHISRHAWQLLGFASLGLGTLGIFLPLLPTVVFYIFAAYCFTRGNPVWEAKLLNHPQFGAHIRAWREKGAISRKGKLAATLAFAFSIGVGALTLVWPWVLAPVLAAVIILSWMWTRPEW